MKFCSFRTWPWTFGEAELWSFNFPNSANSRISCCSASFSSSGVLSFVFRSYSSYSGVLPHCSFALLAYSSIFFVSNTEKSIFLTPIDCNPRAKWMRFSKCSFFIVSSSICCFRALCRSKSGLDKISLISFRGNSNSRNSKICCNFSKAASSYSL